MKTAKLRGSGKERKDYAVTYLRKVAPERKCLCFSVTLSKYYTSLFTMSNLPDKMWDSVQKEYKCHCSNDTSLLLNAPSARHRVCLCVNTWTSPIMQHTAFALRTVWYIYIVKTDSLTAGQISFYPSPKRTEICSLRQCTVQDEGWEQRQRGRKTGKSAVVSMVGSFHLMGWKKINVSLLCGEMSLRPAFFCLWFSRSHRPPLPQLQEIITTSAREEQVCVFLITDIW